MQAGTPQPSGEDGSYKPGNQVADLPPNVHVSLNQGVRPQKSNKANREDIAHFSLAC